MRFVHALATDAALCAARGLTMQFTCPPLVIVVEMEVAAAVKSMNSLPHKDDSEGYAIDPRIWLRCPRAPVAP